MNSCPHETELRDHLAHGQWPAAATPELCAHVEACRSCADLVLVAAAFQKARAGTIAAARPVAPGVLLWRAQLRRRNAVVEHVTRPLLNAHIFALAFTLVVGLGFVVFEALRNDAWRTWLEQLPQSAVTQWDAFRTTGTIDPTWSLTVVLPVLATLFLIGAVAVYLATDRQ